MEALLGAAIGIVLAALISGAVIWLVSKLDLGLKVDNFGWAMLAGLLIGLFTNLIMQFLPVTGGIAQFIINLVVSAVVIFASGAILKGLTVRGYGGALLATVSIAAINLLIGLVLLGGAAMTGGMPAP